MFDVLARKIINKRVHAKQEGLTFYLTREQVEVLLAAANITVVDWRIDGYHLARYGDTGNYTFDNCRFITAQENYREKTLSELSRLTSAKNIKMAHSALMRNPEALARRSNSLARYNAQQKRNAACRRQEYEKTANPSYLNSRNSQFGTYWITDGVRSRKWKDNYGPIPNNFRRGRLNARKLDGKASTS